MNTRNLLLSGLLALSSLTLHAQLLTHESFTYANGNVHTANGGTGWASGWGTQQNASNYQVQSASPLSYGQLTTSGSYLTGGGGFDRTGRQIATNAFSPWDNAGRVSNAWGSQPFGPQIDQGTVWASFVVRRNANVASWDSMDIAFHTQAIGWFSSAANTSLSISYDTTNGNWRAASNNNGNQAALANSALGDTVLFVAKFELSTTGANNIYLWLNPSPGSLGGSDLSVASASWSALNLTTEQARFRSISFYSGSAANATSLDEIRLGLTFADVTPAIPEPSSFAALAGLGVLGMAATRRRRRL
jgi:hypothetical protein